MFSISITKTRRTLEKNNNSRRIMARGQLKGLYLYLCSLPAPYHMLSIYLLTPLLPSLPVWRASDLSSLLVDTFQARPWVYSTQPVHPEGTHTSLFSVECMSGVSTCMGSSYTHMCMYTRIVYLCSTPYCMYYANHYTYRNAALHSIPSDHLLVSSVEIPLHKCKHTHTWIDWEPQQLPRPCLISCARMTRSGSITQHMHATQMVRSLYMYT